MSPFFHPPTAGQTGKKVATVLRKEASSWWPLFPRSDKGSSVELVSREREHEERVRGFVCLVVFLWRHQLPSTSGVPGTVLCSLHATPRVTPREP